MDPLKVIVDARDLCCDIGSGGARTRLQVFQREAGLPVFDGGQYQAIGLQAVGAVATVEQCCAVDVAHLDHRHAVGQRNVQALAADGQNRRTRVSTQRERFARVDVLAEPECMQADGLQKAGAARVGHHHISPAPVCRDDSIERRVFEHDAAFNLAARRVDQVQRNAGVVKPDQPVRAIGRKRAQQVKILRHTGALHRQRAMHQDTGIDGEYLHGRRGRHREPGAAAVTGQRQSDRRAAGVNVQIGRTRRADPGGEPAYATIGGNRRKQLAGGGFGQRDCAIEGAGNGAAALRCSCQRGRPAEIEYHQLRVGGRVTAGERMQAGAARANCQHAHLRTERARRQGR